MNKSALIATFSFLATCSLAVGQDMKPDMKLLLKRCIAAQSAVDRSSMKVTTEITLDYPDQRPKKQRSEILLQRDSNRFNITGAHSYLDVGQNNSYSFRTLENSDYYTTYQVRRGSEVAKSGLIAKKERDKFGKQSLEAAIYGGPLDGQVAGSDSKRIAEMLLDASGTKMRSQESISESTCEVVEGRTRYGTITMWIAPDFGYTCVKFVVDRTGNDLWNGTAISHQPLWSPSGKADDLRPITRCLSVLDNVRVEKIGDHFVPTQGRYTESIYRNRGKTVNDVYVYQRTDILFSPTFATGTFDSDLPVGSTVDLLDESESGVQYRWDGKNAEVAFDDYSGPKGSFESNFTLFNLMVAIIVLAILIGLYVWFHSRKPMSGKE
ncbi:hypothetical protein SAMN05444166_2450 [Singulisphaera sp. GP187]|uniref:hypothetical protein n=1 Tax=Singulisphaera sp. GP187 TaxID=1882752 RepID=UPI0009277C1E|nr:hypothetical protein [Singulisphaera sp. GP187]SIO10081.1 hypothetical protein SAMN05444166_2450 [Singulisphaera sp. GP187]